MLNDTHPLAGWLISQQLALVVKIPVYSVDEWGLAPTLADIS